MSLSLSRLASVEERLQAENFLHGSQRGSVGVGHLIRVAVALGEGRKSGYLCLKENEIHASTEP